MLVPIEVTSNKQEHAAATIRKKITSQMDKFCEAVILSPVNKESLSIVLPDSQLGLSNLNELLDNLPIDQSIQPVSILKGGMIEANHQLQVFVTKN